MTDEHDLAVSGIHAWFGEAWRRLETTRVSFEGADGRTLTAEIDMGGRASRVRLRATPPTRLASRRATILVNPGGGNVASVSSAVQRDDGDEGAAPAPVGGALVVRAGDAGDPFDAARLYTSFGPDHGLLLTPGEDPRVPGGWYLSLRAGLDPSVEEMAHFARTRELKSAHLWLHAEAHDVLVVHTSVAKRARAYGTLDEALTDAGPCRAPTCGCEDFDAKGQDSLQEAAMCTCGHALFAHVPQPGS